MLPLHPFESTWYCRDSKVGMTRVDSEENSCILVVNISVNAWEKKSNWDHAKSSRAGEGLHSNFKLHMLLPHTITNQHIIGFNL